MGAASASSKKMSEEEVFEILDENEEAFGFPKEMSESIAFSWESNVMKFMSENFKTCIPVSLIFQLFPYTNQYHLRKQICLGIHAPIAR